MKKIRTDKDGWYKLLEKKFPPTKFFINDELPNIMCSRMSVPGVLYPWEVRSGNFSDDKKSFYLDGKIKLQGISAGNYYKNKSAIKKLIKKKEAA